MKNITTNPTVAAIVSKLEKKGFRWNSEDEESVFMSRKRGASTVYAQVDCFDGETVTINGESPSDWIKGWA